MATPSNNNSYLDHPERLKIFFSPRSLNIKLSGDPIEINQIKEQVEKLIKACDPSADDICGLYIPISFLFKMLGFDWLDNTGNLMHTRSRGDSFTLSIECNSGVEKALAEAFQRKYPNIAVKITNRR